MVLTTGIFITGSHKGIFYYWILQQDSLLLRLAKQFLTVGSHTAILYYWILQKDSSLLGLTKGFFTTESYTGIHYYWVSQISFYLLTVPPGWFLFFAILHSYRRTGRCYVYPSLDYRVVVMISRLCNELCYDFPDARVFVPPQGLPM